MVKRSLASFITAYTNLLYYLGLCPFKLVFTNNHQKKPCSVCTLKRCMPQTIFVVFVQAVLLWGIVAKIRYIDFTNTTNPAVFMEMLSLLFHLFFQLEYTYIFLLHSPKLLVGVNYIFLSRQFQLSPLSEVRAFRIKILLQVVVHLSGMICRVVNAFTGFMPIFYILKFKSLHEFWLCAISVGRFIWGEPLKPASTDDVNTLNSILAPFGIITVLHGYV